MPLARNRDMPASHEAAERPETAAADRRPTSQPATEEAPWRSQSSSSLVPANASGKSMHAPANLLVCRSCSEVACGLCKPLACLMAWAHRNVQLAQLRKVSSTLRTNKSKNQLSLSIAFRRADRGPWPIDRPIDRPIDSLSQQPISSRQGSGPARVVTLGPPRGWTQGGQSQGDARHQKAEYM